MPTSFATAGPLTRFRSILSAHSVDYWLQPINDEFQGEYVPAYAERLSWLSGFHASAGMGVIAARPSAICGLMVDGRYIVQAVQEMDATVWNSVNSGEESVAQWLSEKADPGAVIACDAWLHTHAHVKRLGGVLQDKGFRFTPLMQNLVDAAWTDRPTPPTGDVECYPESLAGQTIQEKILAVSHQLDGLGLDALVITQPDAIAWLLNIRGSDIPFNPLLLAYAILTRGGDVYLITHPRTFQPEIERYFSVNRVHCHTFAEWFGDPAILSRLDMQHMRFGIDPTLAAHAWWVWAEEVSATFVPIDDPIQRMKATKYPAEQDGMREAHRKDAVSLVHFLSELHVRKDRGISELEIVAALEDARSSDNTYRGPSFATISGSGPNGAIVHYRVTEQTNRVFQEGELLLLDSGGQYLEGTTDITRMVPLGRISDEIMDRYTRVLKGHIALASVQFPIGTTGRQLDTLARQYLWRIGCDYDHGTGHGVGTYLCVHEGPQRISKKGSDVPLEPGMVISNEPGYYKANAYGIRIENLVMVVEGELPGTLKFETITLVPIDTTLIDMSLMRPDEIAWLDAYHVRVQYQISPHLRNAEARAWLMQACLPLA